MWRFVGFDYKEGGFTLLKLFIAALAPTMICAFYVYIRDKYEKEPLRLLFLGVFFGILIAAPVVHVENFITLFLPNVGVLGEAFYMSFAVAGFVEEIFKYLVLFFLVWRNNNFNERFDGIVYAVFVSLGFAGIENILYVLHEDLGGMNTAVMRAIFSVPAHALFGVFMGYHFALAKFEPHNKKYLLAMAFFLPFLVHGLYDFILMSKLPYLMVIFVVFVAFLWIQGFKKMKEHINASPFMS